MTQTFVPQAFLRFCREKPAGEWYDGGNAHCCALAQFGFPYAIYHNHRDMGISDEVYDAAVRGLKTFGALADRLEKVLSDG